jgi:hypothetical protein
MVEKKLFLFQHNYLPGPGENPIVSHGDEVAESAAGCWDVLVIHYPGM